MSRESEKYVRLCLAEEIPEGSLKRFEVEGKEVLLARKKGEFFAIEARCTHRGGPLSEGSLEDSAITCPWHFGQFSLATGTVLSPPPTQPLKTHRVLVENGSVFVGMIFSKLPQGIVQESAQQPA